jgi:hypothetical protein
MATIIKLVQNDPVPQQVAGENVIERLEELLELAKAGEISNVAIAATYWESNTQEHGSAIGTGWANGNAAVMMVAALKILGDEFQAANIESSL